MYIWLVNMRFARSVMKFGALWAGLGSWFMEFEENTSGRNDLAAFLNFCSCQSLSRLASQADLGSITFNERLPI
jgi:hypothetical protein